MAVVDKKEVVDDPHTHHLSLLSVVVGVVDTVFDTALYFASLPLAALLFLLLLLHIPLFSFGGGAAAAVCCSSYHYSLFGLCCYYLLLHYLCA